MSKGVSQCALLWVGSSLIRSTPSIALPYPLPPTCYFSTSVNTHPYILCHHRCYILQYYPCSIISLFLSPLPRVPQVHSTVSHVFYIWVLCEHACFVYFIFWTYLPHRREKVQWGVVLVGAGRVNEGDEGEGIWLMDFIYLYKIEQRNLLWLL
jgi:hypothetical protein